MAAFAELGLCPQIIRSIESDDLQWLLPTPVQQEAVPLILGGGDVMAAAETGSGKTGAFALPILQICHEALHEQQMASAKPKMAAVAAQRAAAAAAAGAGVGADRDGLLQVSTDGMQVSCSAEAAWAGARAGIGVSGSVTSYFEVSQLTDGLCRVGWSTLAARLELGKDAHGFGFGGTGKKSNNNKFEEYGEAYGRGDVIGCMLDRKRRLVSYFKNGAPLGEAFTLPAGVDKHALFPAVCLKNCTVRMNLGAAPLGTPPPGAKPVAMLPAEHTAKNSAGGAYEADDAPASGSGGGSGGGGGGRAPLALILEPARDLCEQVHDCVVQFGRFFTEPRLSACLLVGGGDGNAQLKQLKSGVDIVCGTPGRVQDLVKQKKLSLSRIQFFVLDEADRLLDTGNLSTILELHAKLPKQGVTGARLQTLLFSATLHTPEVRTLAEKITVHPTLVDLKGKEHVPETVQHVVVHIDPESDTSWAEAAGSTVPTDGVHAHDKVGRAVGSAEAHSEAVKRLKPLVLLQVVERLQMTQCLVFCRTNLDCDHLEAFLNAAGGGKGFRGKAEKGVENPYSCVVLAGMRSMDERRRSLAAFKEGDVRFMVCTDVAARGLDIKELPCVINMTLPDKEEDYVHRVGRVGRAEVMGLAVSLVATKHKEKVWYYDKRKWEGKTLSTKLAPGGCCIWYDEPALFDGVQKRLGAKIETLDAFLQRTPGGVSALNATLGQAKDGGLNAATSEHLSELAPHVLELAALEVSAQHSFLCGIMHQANGGSLPSSSLPTKVPPPAVHPAAHQPRASSSTPPANAATKRPIKEATDEGDDNLGEADDAGGNAAAASLGQGAGGGARGSGKHRRHRGRGGGSAGGGKG